MQSHVHHTCITQHEFIFHPLQIYIHLFMQCDTQHDIDSYGCGTNLKSGSFH